MPVGATIGAAVIGAGAGIYGSSQAAKAQKKAAGKAADMSLQVAQTNNAFAQSIYDQNSGKLTPFIDMGGLAGDELMGLLLGPARSGGTSSGGTSSGNGYYTPQPTKAGTGAGGATPPMSLDDWANGAIAAMAPNITRSSTWEQANTISDPYEKLQYLLSQSPPNSDQYPLYQAYVAANPQPAVSAATTAATAAPATAPDTAPATTPVAAPATATVPAAPAPTNAVANGISSPFGPGGYMTDGVAEPAAAPASAIGGVGSLVGRGDDLALPSYGSGSLGATNAGTRAQYGIPDGPGGADSVWLGGNGSGTGVTTPPAATPPASTPPATTPPATGTAPNNALSAWDTFRNSTNYQFRLDQGLEAVNTKYAAMGALESGAAMKAIDDYAQNFASNELANYMDQLYRQEALGASAASSLAGVGTNLVSQVSANNTNAANAAANAALAQGQANANQWNNIGGAIGTAAGAIGGAMSSSYAPAGYDYGALQQSGIYGNAWNF